MKAISAGNLGSVINIISKYDVIGIDEGQFFADLSKVCDELATQGKIVVVAALDGDFKRKVNATTRACVYAISSFLYLLQPFGSTLDLIPMAEDVTKLSSVCMSCFQTGSFSKRCAFNKQKLPCL